jgi:MSHA type pilus biogenesis protein MshL
MVKTGGGMNRIFLVFLLVVMSCSGVTGEVKDTTVGAYEAGPEALPPEGNGGPAEAGVRGKESNVDTAQGTVLRAPEFQPAAEDISPLSKRIVSVSVRNEPLRNVLKVIAEAANLNLVMQKGVDPELPVTITLHGVSVQDALEIIFSSADYFYEIRKNLLVVKAQDTVIFEFGHPSVVNNYSISLGGDILGGVSSSASQGSTSSSGSTNMTGDVSLEGETDKAAENLWDQIAESLANVLASDGGSTALKPSFSINRVTGTIVVTASRNTLRRAEDLLRNVWESLNRQVLIEARIVEVQLSEGFKYGIDWEAVSGSFRWGTQPAVVGFADVVKPTEPSFQFEVITSNFTTLLKALQTQGTVNVLSNPRVSLMNGQTALLGVGRNVNFISKVETTTTTTGTTGIVTFTTETSSVLSGLIIGIVPYISPDGHVSMTITPIITDLISLKDEILGTPDGASLKISLPTIDLREMSTTVRVRDGEMVVIGGLISDKEVERENGIPVLSSIPLIGNLFKSVERTGERSELVIMLQPVIARAE